MFNINSKNLISLTLGLLALFVLSFSLTTKSVYANDCVGNTGWYESYCGNYQNTNYYNNSNNSNSNNNINPVPFINSISPNSGRLNTSTTVVVTGYNFVPGSIVKWNSEDRPTTYIGSETLKAQLYSSDLNTTGNYLITVSNPIPGGGLSNAVLFTINNVVASSSTNTSKTSNSSVTKKTTTNTTTNTNNTSSSNTTDQSNNNQAKDLAAGAIFGYNGFLPSSIFQWIFFFILILLAVVLWRKLYVSDEERHDKPLKHA